MGIARHLQLLQKPCGKKPYGSRLGETVLTDELTDDTSAAVAISQVELHGNIVPIQQH